MLDNNIKIEKKEALEYDPIPENIYQVELLDITAEMKPKYQSNETEMKFSFQFVLLNGKGKDGKDLRAVRSLWRNFVPTSLYISSKTGKNVLYQIIEALIQRPLSPEDEATMSSERLNKLIGRQCRVVVKNQTKNEKTYSNIESFAIIDNTLPSLTPEEKEIARVKKDKKQPDDKNPLNIPQFTPEITSQYQDQEEEINIDSIPF